MDCLSRQAIPAPADAAWLLEGLEAAIFDGVGIEESLGLPEKWRCQIRAAERRAAMVPLYGASARQLLKALQDYRRQHYRADLERPPEPGTVRAACLVLLRSFGGEVPSLSAIYKLLARVKNPPCFLHTEPEKDANHGDQKIRKRASADRR